MFYASWLETEVAVSNGRVRMLLCCAAQLFKTALYCCPQSCHTWGWCIPQYSRLRSNELVTLLFLYTLELQGVLLGVKGTYICQNHYRGFLVIYFLEIEMKLSEHSLTEYGFQSCNNASASADFELIWVWQWIMDVLFQEFCTCPALNHWLFL